MVAVAAAKAAKRVGAAGATEDDTPGCPSSSIRRKRRVAARSDSARSSEMKLRDRILEIGFDENHKPRVCSDSFTTMSSAADFKAKGNAALQAGNFDDAIDAYTEAIELDATNHVFYSNRSAAYLSNDNGEAALADAELCIKTKGDWAKGFNRKGAALHHLGRLEDAIAAFEEGKCPYCWQGLTLFSVAVL